MAPRKASLPPGGRAALGALLAAGAAGARGAAARAVARARAAGIDDGTLREALLMLVPYAGYPRAIAALTAARLPAAGDTGGEVPAAERAKRGRAAFGRVYGETAVRVLAGLGALDPRLPAWTLEFAYGRVLARPALALIDRELLAVSLLTGLGDLDDALLGHMRGAARLGAAPADVAAAVDCVPQSLGAARKGRARTLLARLSS